MLQAAGERRGTVAAWSSEGEFLGLRICWKAAWSFALVKAVVVDISGKGASPPEMTLDGCCGDGSDRTHVVEDAEVVSCHGLSER